MRVWIVSKESDLDLTDEQINGWRNFLHLAMEKGCLRTTLAEDSESCLLYTSPSPRDMRRSRMPSSA